MVWSTATHLGRCTSRADQTSFSAIAQARSSVRSSVTISCHIARLDCGETATMHAHLRWPGRTGCLSVVKLKNFTQFKFQLFTHSSFLLPLTTVLICVLAPVLWCVVTPWILLFHTQLHSKLNAL